MMKSAQVAILAAALALFGGQLAKADNVTFSFSGGGITSSGSFSVAPSGTPGYWNVTGITGTYTDTNDGISGAITGLYTPISYTAPPSGTPAHASSGFSYDDTFYPGGNSPHNCSDYPFFGGVLDVYGIAFTVNGGYIADLWSDGVMPGIGQVYAAGDSNLTTLLYDPNPDGADETKPTGQPVTLATTVSPEPSSFFLMGAGVLGTIAAVVRRKKAAVR